MVNKPKPPPTDDDDSPQPSARDQQKLAIEVAVLKAQIATMKWIMGFCFGLVLITNGVIVTLIVLLLSWNDTLRDDLHQHELGHETPQISEH